MGMKSFKIDPALYCYMFDGALKGLSGSYIDDLLRAGDQDFRKVSKETNKCFEMTEDRKLPSEFTDFVFGIDRNGNFVVDQNAYMRMLECIPTDATCAHFRAARMKLAWLANSRPDRLFEISQLAQVTEELINSSPKAIINRMEKAVKYAADSRVRLKMPELDLESVKIVGYSDSSFPSRSS